MKAFKRILVSSGLTGLTLIAIFAGCTRQISVPVSPTFTQSTNTFTPTLTTTNTTTDTPTSTNIFTSTATSTPTVTPSFTPSSTPSNTATQTPTATPTNTNIGGFTNTFTDTPTITPTFTVTNTPTFTFTLTFTSTATATPTATINPHMIADFEEGGTADVTGSALNLTGVWYAIGSAGTSPAPPASLTPSAGGCASSGNYAQVTGTTGSSAPVYAALQGDFINPAGPYNIITSDPTANAFVFCIKGSAPGGQVYFSVSDSTTNATSDNAGMMVPITGSWQSVTVCFNHMQSQGWGSPGHMFDPTTAISFSWKVTTASSAFDIGIDNFQFADVGTVNCPTFSPTPTPDYGLIDDFEGTGGGTQDSSDLYQVTDEAGKFRDGNWYSYTDTVNGSTSTVSYAGSPANSGTKAVEFSGTMSQQGSYAGYGFTFTNPNDGGANQGVSFYDGTVGNRYIGISFYIKAKSMAATNCTGAAPLAVDLVDQGGLDHNLIVPVTSTYTAVTVFYNQALSSTGVLVDATNLFQMVFKPQSNGVANYSYDFLVDDIRLVAVGAPGAPSSPATPMPANVIDLMTTGSNQTQYGSNAGYWYDYAGGASTMCPRDQAFFKASPGHTAQVIPGIPSFAVHYSGVQGDYSGVGFWFNNGNTYTDISAYNQIVLWAKSQVGPLSFNVTFADSTSVGCYGTSVNSTSLTAGTTWAPVTLTFNQGAVGYQFGQVSGSNGTNGCTGGTFTSHKLDATQAGKLQFEANGGAYDLWLDDLYLQ